MWAIFVVLFGALYWAFKIGSDKAVSRSEDAKIGLQQHIQNTWRSLVVDDELEAQITTNLLIPETAALLKSNSLELIRSFHGLERAGYNQYYNAKYKDYYVSALVIYIELIKLGKLPSLNCREIPNYLELAIDISPSKRARVEFCTWVEKTLRDNGVKEAKIFYTGESYGSFSWAPYVLDPSKAVPLSHPDIEEKMLGLQTEEMDARNAVATRHNLK